MDACVQRGGRKRNNAGMMEPDIPTPETEAEPGVISDETVYRYAAAIEKADPADVAAPASALADLLAARLEGTDAPAARAVLEAFAPAPHPSAEPCA